MDWMGLKEEHKLLRHDIKKFAETELSPQVIEKDKTGEPQKDSFKKIGDIGGLGLLVSEKFDGVGMDFLSLVITAEELAKVSPSFALSVSAHNLVGDLISVNGTEGIKTDILSDIATGKKIVGLSIDTMLHPQSEENTEERLIINGSFSDAFGYTKKDGDDFRFIIQRKTDDLKVENGIMGMRMSGICSFDASKEKPNGSTFPIESEQFFSKMRLVFAGIATGMAQSSLEHARAYAKERKQFDRPIASFGMVRTMLAEMATHANASRMLVYEASSVDNIFGRDVAAVFAIESNFKVADKGVQIYGGYGYTKDYPLEMFFRDAKTLDVFSGSADYRKVLIGKKLTE